MRILFVTDAWAPQTNGVVTTLTQTIAELSELGHECVVIEPSAYRTLPMPLYSEIHLACNPFDVGRRIRKLQPDAVHIATEGPLGIVARNWLRKRGIPFSTSLHTKFPEYLHARLRLPVRWGYAFLRWFHGAAHSTLVTTLSQRAELEARGLRNLVVWGRGVDTRRFRPQPRALRDNEPLLLYVGRLSVEKNIEAFLAARIPGRKVVVGDGPQRAELERRFPDAEFLGYRFGDRLTECYAQADVFVFPSRTDTFGLVMLEALACGTPVAAYPVTGPRDVIIDGETGALDEDLERAIRRALTCGRDRCRRFAEANDWRATSRRLLRDLARIEWHGRTAVPVASA